MDGYLPKKYFRKKNDKSLEDFVSDEYERTVISIVDEHGENSSITLDKWTSDVLHENVKDVHVWIQRLYNAVCEKNSSNNLKLSRRERGNVVRQYANRKAMEFKPIEIDLSDINF